ncbi:MAG: carotenoid oxygenase family protein [Myxococcota bacterium]|nr:carotenoid oxygenase family protein [Myxococcota bacterium]
MTDSNPYLEGNFAPVEGEITTGELPVTGTLPEVLEGQLLRIGPNPANNPDPKHHHWFVGTGMVHGVRIEDGKAMGYRRRYVRDEASCQVFGWPPVPGPRHSEMGGGGANTNIIRHAGRNYAIVEAGGNPVELDDDLETVATSDFFGTLPGGFTAHPKKDPVTGELFALAYYFGWEHVQMVVVGTDGRVRRTVDVPAPHKPMIHDCSITENWFAIFDLPVDFDPSLIEHGVQLPYSWQDRPARVGLLPREGNAEDVVWAEVDPCWIFHPLNAYEDASGRVVIDVVRHPKMFATDFRGPNEGATTLDRWTIDPSGGPVKEERLDDHGEEFPRHDERLVGRPYRYGYAARLSEGFKIGGLLKHDLEKGTTDLYDDSPETSYLEPVFVPRDDDADEDDGWIVTIRYDHRENASEFVVLHAQDLGAGPVARVALPERVPFGFHGNWVPKGE